MSSIDQTKLIEARDFYKNRILGWMISDLEKSIKAETNFLTALGCLIYTEIIGIFLPPLNVESGSLKEKRFYRCLFRLKSHEYLKNLDKLLRKETNNRGIYLHLRHSMAHKYFPTVGKKSQNVYLSIPSVVARDGLGVDISTGQKQSSPPIFMTDDGRIIIATRNYTQELKEGVSEFIKTTFDESNYNFQSAAVSGLDTVLRGQE